MIRFVICRGIPASGKSTYARKLVEKGYKRVNRDDLRAMVDSSKWSKANEKLIKSMERAMVSYMLLAGENVIVDDTNCDLRTVEEWAALARTVNPSVEVRVALFNTPLAVCLERNAKREGVARVPDPALQRLHRVLQSSLEDGEQKANVEEE